MPKAPNQLSQFVSQRQGFEEHYSCIWHNPVHSLRLTHSKAKRTRLAKTLSSGPEEGSGEDALIPGPLCDTEQSTKGLGFANARSTQLVHETKNFCATIGG